MNRGCVVSTPGTPATMGMWVSEGGGISTYVPGKAAIPATQVCQYGPFDSDSPYYGCSASPDEQAVTSCPGMGFVGCCVVAADYECFYAPTTETEAMQQCSGKWVTTLP
jgi:hypothetical protein